MIQYRIYNFVNICYCLILYTNTFLFAIIKQFSYRIYFKSFVFKTEDKYNYDEHNKQLILFYLVGPKE